jgi:transcription elongation factor SPT5
MQLLQKCYNMAERGTPLAIKSAVCLDHLKGFFYVEAFRDSHVSCCTDMVSSVATCSAVW